MNTPPRNPIDLGFVDRMTAIGGAEFASTMIQLHRKQTKRDFRRLLAAVEQKNERVARLMVSELKAQADSVGARYLRVELERLGLVMEEQGLDGLDKCLAEVARQLEIVRQQLHKLLNHPPIS